MRAFIGVSLFFVLFSAIVGGSLFLAVLGVKALHLSDDYEPSIMVLAGILSLVVAGLLMKSIHAIIERRL